MPRRLSLALACVAYGLIAGVVADIPTIHKTVNAFDPNLLYHPSAPNQGADCVHTPCSGWWSESASAPLQMFGGLMRSTTFPGSQLQVKFSGSSFVAIAGHMDAGRVANVTINGQSYQASQFSGTSILELHNLAPGSTQEMQLTWFGPGKLSIAALYFDGAAVMGPLTTTSTSKPGVPAGTPHTIASTVTTSRKNDKPSDSSRQTTLLPVTTLGPGASPNGPPTPTIENSDSGTADNRAATDQPADPVEPSSTGTAQSPTSPNPSSPPEHHSRRAAIAGGCVAGVLALILVCAGLLLLRRRLIARRAASHDFIRARAIAAWNEHWTVRPSSPTLDIRTWDQTSEADASQVTRTVHAM